MDNLTPVARQDTKTVPYVPPMHDQTYHEVVKADTLGGSDSYFITRDWRNKCEQLAKAANPDTAREAFGMLAATRSAAP